MRSTLIIHPEFFWRCDLEDYLSMKGFRVETANSYQKGLFKIRGQVFSTLLLKAPKKVDVLFTFLDELRKIRPQTPVVVLMNQATDQTIQQLAEDELVDVMLEPFSRMELERRLSRACNQNGNKHVVGS